jgi:2-hydroxychromene-2-carboxylate isomerase
MLQPFIAAAQSPDERRRLHASRKRCVCLMPWGVPTFVVRGERFMIDHQLAVVLTFVAGVR